MPSTWERRKRRLHEDPEFRRRVYQHQTESRRRKRARALGADPAHLHPCDHLNRIGVVCGRLDAHQHREAVPA